MKKKLNCILLVDDDETFNYLHKRSIMKAGVAEHVEVVENAQDALDYLKHYGIYKETEIECKRPDLIFLDINMPGMSGWEFLEEYKKLSDNQKAKIILVMLTSSVNPEDEKKAEQTGKISKFVNKPFTIEKLIDTLKVNFPEHF
jgi:CheY-like chemotaxis protein